MQIIQGVTSTELYIAKHPKGDVYRVMRCSDESYCGYGEVYVSTIRHGETKGWKKHNEMTMNLVVISGLVEFTFARLSGSIILEKEKVIAGPSESYVRLTVLPGVWMSFKGLKYPESKIINVSNIVHSDEECSTMSLEDGFRIGLK